MVILLLTRIQRRHNLPMDEAEKRRHGSFGHTGTKRAEPSDRVPGRRAPTAVRAFVRLHWTRMAVGLLLLLGITVQCALIWAAGELVDLYVSSVELWAELARKHLELTS